MPTDEVAVDEADGGIGILPSPSDHKHLRTPKRGH